jgi:chromosome partitioning protein
MGGGVGRIIAIVNQKGGVGKTTTALNLAVALALSDRQVLLVDLDPQGNATSGLSRASTDSDKAGNDLTVYDSLVNRAPLSGATRMVRDKLALVPSNTDLVAAELELSNATGREKRLKDAFNGVDIQYNYVLIDTPPSLGLLTLNALVAADSVLVPTQCEYYALEGLGATLETLRRVKSALNPTLELEGLVLTMFDARNRLCHEIAREVREHFPDRLFRTIIPRNVRLSESPSHGLSVMEYDPHSTGAQAYRSLAVELIEREQETRAPLSADQGEIVSNRKEER